MTEQSAIDLLTIHEVAEKLRVDDTTVRRWAKEGALEVIELPHKGRRKAYRVRKSVLDTILGGTVAISEV